MYIVFLMLTPFARALARRWSWELVLSLSLGLWAGAQCGLRHFLFTKLHLFGLAVPENSTGAFDLYAWQLLWLAGLAWGTRDADSRSRSADSGLPAAARMSGWLRPLSVMLAIAFLLWRYSPAETWPSPRRTAGCWINGILVPRG